MVILGIESSCDETSAAVIDGDKKTNKINLLSNITASSLFMHSKTGGIIPESAAREQVKFIIPVIQRALEEAKLTIKNIDKIAVTYGPGLIGSLLVGVETAKAISYACDIPVTPVNHLLGHIYANLIDQNLNPTTYPLQPGIKFPAIGLIVSGGHTDLILLKNHGDLKWLGGTLDDAAGECFDKCARLLGYEYPGGPKIAQLALKGNPNKFAFPRPMIYSKNFDFSFSGLKTAFLYETMKHFPILRTNHEKSGWQQIALEEHVKESHKQIIYDLCASLEKAIVDVIIKKTLDASKKHNAKSILIGGGVAANQSLRDNLKLNAKRYSLNAELFAPEKWLCTDNGAMIAIAALFNDQTIKWQDLNANPGLYFN